MKSLNSSLKGSVKYYISGRNTYGGVGAESHPNPDNEEGPTIIKGDANLGVTKIVPMEDSTEEEMYQLSIVHPYWNNLVF